MRIFSALYTRVMTWVAHPRAPWYLAGLSFTESSFFPIPPDVMLAPMALARRNAAWRLAAVTTAASVAGGVLGYFIGVFAFEMVEPWLHSSGYWSAYLTAKDWFMRWGMGAILIAAFTPIPYKVFTIAAGTLAMPLLPFMLASLLGRGARFYLVAGLMYFGGARMEQFLRRYVDGIGWAVIILAISAYLIYVAVR